MSAALLSWSIALCLLPAALAQSDATPTTEPDPLAPVADAPGLPRVLLIGDSISIDYTLPVRELLAGSANVHRPTENCGPTSLGVEKLDEWLGDGKWDVIHFNFGLHDIRRMDDGSRRVEPATYEENLRIIVARLKQTGAKLIWAHTTPFPNGRLYPIRILEDVGLYNSIAERVMKENGVAINDLYAFALPRLAELQRPNNVHFTPKGSRALAQQVVAKIREAL